MIGRLLVAALLLHHIEGVCRPWSAATLAARAAASAAAEVAAALLRKTRQERSTRVTGALRAARAERSAGAAVLKLSRSERLAALPRAQGRRAADALPFIVDGEVLAVEVER